jgi:hypothetical protein
MRLFVIDLYTGKAKHLPSEDFVEATQGLKKTETSLATTYLGEEYIVVVLK